MKEHAGAPAARWWMAAFLGLAAALNYADRAAMSAVLSAVREDFGLSDVALGLLGSVFLWSYALGSPLAGILADRGAQIRLVVGSLLAWSVVTTLMGLANGFGVLLSLRFLLGVSESLFLPAAFALVAAGHGVDSRARAMSFITIGINGGMVLGGSFTGYVAEHHGWRSGFWILGAMGIVLALVVRGFLPRGVAAQPAGPGAPRAEFLPALRYLVGVPSYLVLVTESMLSGFGMWVFFTWLPLYFREAYQMSMAGAGFAGTFMLQIAVMLGIFTGGFISDRVSAPAPQRRMLLYGLFYLVGAPFLLLFLDRPAFPILACGIAAFSFCRGLGQANDNATQCEVVPAHFRATGIGVMNGISTAAGGGGVLIAAFLKRSIGLESIFAGIAGIFLLAGIALVCGYRFWMRADIARAQAAEKAFGSSSPVIIG